MANANTGRLPFLPVDSLQELFLLCWWRERLSSGASCQADMFFSCFGSTLTFGQILRFQGFAPLKIPRVPLSPRRSASSFRELALIRYIQDVKSWKVKLQRLSPLLLLKQLKLSTPSLSFRISHIQLAISWWCSEAWEQAIGVVCCLSYFMLQLI